ncbi:hypothetical protein [Fodinibius sp. Rm-B-1B1-1]|uniref:hypothetical protein n=1 Tax=Fodinibius alkaliphilus TaxID=3140241 RepID=UPI00315A9630
MQTYLNNSFHDLNFVHLIVALVVLAGLSACENPGSVGGDITDPTADVVRDTLMVDNLRSIDATSYSGELNFFSAGSYDDPLLGALNATGYIKPFLPSENDTMRADGEMLMRLMFDAEQVYGDSLSSQQFDLYEIGQFWRHRALKVNDELDLESQKVGEFTVGGADSMVINLSDIAPDWVDKYRAYAQESKEDTTGQADSTYIYEAHGLALVPQNNGKIIPIHSDSTNFIIQHPEADTFSVGLSRWGYHLSRGQDSSPQGTLPLHSTYESVLNFDNFGLSEIDIEPAGLSRAVLVLHEDTEALEQSLNGEPPAAKRAKEQTAFLQLANPDGLPENIDPGAPLNTPSRLQGTYLPEDGTYRFDITALVENIIRNGFPEDREFFVTLPNDGAIKSTLIMGSGDQVSDSLKPKIIITSLKNINN